MAAAGSGGTTIIQGVNVTTCIVALCFCCYALAKAYMSNDISASEIARQSGVGRVGDVFWVALRVDELRRAKEIRQSRPLAPRAPLLMLICRPAVAVLIGMNITAFGLLRIFRIPPEAVAVNCDFTVGRREYWRCLTAAFSHFDTWHLLMNVLSLWNLGACIVSVRFRFQVDLGVMRARCRLEDIHGSTKFALASVAAGAAADFVSGIGELAIRRLQAAQILRATPNAGRVGFSGVIFSWFVVAAVAMPSYCLFGYMCFATHNVFQRFRFNPAPLVLAVATQMVLPRASFLGHAAGIAVGFPLAWGMLEVLTPTNIATILAVIDTALISNVQLTPTSMLSRPYSSLAALLQSASGLALWRAGFSYTLVISVETAAIVVVLGSNQMSRSLTATPFLISLTHAMSMAGLAGSLADDPVRTETAVASLLAHVVAATLLATETRRSFRDCSACTGQVTFTKLLVNILLHADSFPLSPRRVPFSGNGRILGSQLGLSMSSALQTSTSLPAADLKPDAAMKGQLAGTVFLDQDKERREPWHVGQVQTKNKQNSLLSVANNDERLVASVNAGGSRTDHLHDGISI